MCYNDFFPQWRTCDGLVIDPPTTGKNLPYLIFLEINRVCVPFVILPLHNYFAHVCREWIKWWMRVKATDFPSVELLQYIQD